MDKEPAAGALPPVPPPAEPPSIPSAARVKACANCGAPMHGPFCYACGQPEKGMIRHLASVMADVADTIFNVDSRIFRSLFPLYFRPGYLTTEYFAGRRTRYVTPFRLFFFLCVISFFAIQISLNIESMHFSLAGDGGGDHGIQSAQTEVEVREREQAALDGIAKALQAPVMPAAASAGLHAQQAKVRTRAAQRLAWIAAKRQAEAKGEKAPPDPDASEPEISFDGTPWDPVKHPISILWLPDFANAELNAMAARAKDNIVAAKRDPRHLIRSLFSVLPATLFVLMPLFAVLLKIIYIFKRRLYMEHLMVALHSHAFIFMSLLLVAILTLLIGWSSNHVEWATPGLRFLRVAAWTWLPVYLLLMQKRVYRHGWFMAIVAYGFIGICYTVILGFGLAGALLASLTLA